MVGPSVENFPTELIVHQRLFKFHFDISKTFISTALVWHTITVQTSSTIGSAVTLHHKDHYECPQTPFHQNINEYKMFVYTLDFLFHFFHFS